MEMKWLQMAVKGVSREDRTVEGMASTSQPDLDHEVILPSAWKKSLAAWKRRGSRPKFLAYHQQRLIDGHSPVIGGVEWMEITDDGLKFKAWFANTDLGNEHLELYASGAMDAFSVGFTPLVREYDAAKIAKLLDKHGIKAKPEDVAMVTTMADIGEVSAVVLGANMGALVTASADSPLAAKALNRLEKLASLKPGVDLKAAAVEGERFEFDAADEDITKLGPAEGLVIVGDPDPLETVKDADTEPGQMEQIIKAVADLGAAFKATEARIAEDIKALAEVFGTEAGAPEEAAKSEPASSAAPVADVYDEIMGDIAREAEKIKSLTKKE